MAESVRSTLEDAGYEDLPANGPYVLSATTVAGVPLAEIIERLGLSKQAAGHLVDLLVLRGYLDRQVDPEDRRRLVMVPTERGVAAARLINKTANLLENRLAAVVGHTDLQTTRRTLACLAAMADDVA